jgi:ABC-2 type transport system permease protein
MKKAIRQTWVLFGRSLRHILRSPDTIMTIMVQPVIFMLLFVYVFGGAVKNSLPPETNYVTYQLPGILIMTIAMGITYSAIRVFLDREKGMLSRLNSMPVNRSSFLWGHILTSLISNAVSLCFVMVIAFIMGFRTSAGLLEWLGITGILTFLILALTWVAMIAGLTAKTAEGASAISYPVAFLPFVSSTFVPVETMPPILRVFAENQPTTPIVETLRALLNGTPVGSNAWIALAWCFGILITAWFIAMRIYKRQLR